MTSAAATPCHHVAEDDEHGPGGLVQHQEVAVVAAGLVAVRTVPGDVESADFAVRWQRAAVPPSQCRANADLQTVVRGRRSSVQAPARFGTAAASERRLCLQVAAADAVHNPISFNTGVETDRP